MKHLANLAALLVLSAMTFFTAFFAAFFLFLGSGIGQPIAKKGEVPQPGPEQNALQMIEEGRHTFRYDTFADEEFWGDALQLHRLPPKEKQ
jgi:hypothetical protein